MELSKRVAYLRGLMAGLKISEDTPEGQVLLCMADILEQMADEVEENTHAVTAVTDYIDELEDGGDPFDEIDTYEYGYDPTEDESYGEMYDAPVDNDNDEDGESLDTYDEGSERYNELLNNITSDPDYTDKEVPDRGKLADTLEDIVREELAKEAAQEQEKLNDHSGDKDAEEQALLERLRMMMEQAEEQSPIDDDYDEDEDELIFAMNCPVCHSDITFAESDIRDEKLRCPACGNTLTVLM